MKLYVHIYIPVSYTHLLSPLFHLYLCSIYCSCIHTPKYLYLTLLIQKLKLVWPYIMLFYQVRFFVQLCVFWLMFQNDERKHRTEVFVMVVTEELPEWEDSRSIGKFLKLNCRKFKLPLCYFIKTQTHTHIMGSNVQNTDITSLYYKRNLELQSSSKLLLHNCI